MPKKRIVLATIGSLGDLHPMLALGIELQRRGHAVTIASTAHYRERVERLGLAFHPMRPDWNPTDRDLIARCENIRRGPEVLFRELVLPHLRGTYEDLSSAARDADLMLAGELVYAAPLAAEKLGKPWASVILSPVSFLSTYDPSLLVNVPSAYRLRRAGWRINRALLELGKLATRHWWTPVRELRRELGLSPQCDPVFRDKFSPSLVLALFSRILAQPQPDWPPQTIQPGFVFPDFAHHDQQGSPDSFDGALEGFMNAGEAPIVFTQGSTAVHNPGAFYEVSSAAARALGRRALLIGVETRPPGADSRILAVPYAAYAGVFPRAAAIVHQGGSGTTGQALRAGKPQLIVPYGWDQPDNGRRVARLGAGLCLDRRSYTPSAAGAALRKLLSEPDFAERAAVASQDLQREDALAQACDAIESLLARTQPAAANLVR